MPETNMQKKWTYPILFVLLAIAAVIAGVFLSQGLTTRNIAISIGACVLSIVTFFVAKMYADSPDTYYLNKSLPNSALGTHLQDLDKYDKINLSGN